MNPIRHATVRLLAAAAACMAITPAHATWHPVIEGEFFSEFDAPDAPPSFNIFPAGIYDPTVHLVGTVDWQADASDTIYFNIGPAGVAGYELQQFRLGFTTDPRLTSGSQGLRLTLSAADALASTVLSVDVMAGAGGSAAFVDDVLRLQSGRLYALKLSVLGSTDSGAHASYGLGFTVADPVPEPATWALLMGGAAVLPWVARRRGRTSGRSA